MAIAQKYANVPQRGKERFRDPRWSTEMYSIVLTEEEYLIAEDAQFFVTAVGITIFPDGNEAI